MKKVKKEHLAKGIGYKYSDRKHQGLIGVPVSALIQEASNLYHWVQNDKDKVLKAGLEWKLVEGIPDQIIMCKDLAAQWNKIRNTQNTVEKQWNIQIKEAREFHAQILAGFRYAFRKHKTLLKYVSEMSGYRTNTQLIQDLNNVSVIGRKNKKLLDLINFPQSHIDKAALLSDNLATLLAERENEKAEKSAFYARYKTTCLNLKESLAKIRACGRYVFADDKSRLTGYRSEYRHIHRYKRK